MALTEQEIAELAALEKGEEEAEQARADAFDRQRLEAKRLRKKLAGKHGEHGRDFLVVVTTAGNFAMRRAVDVELDALGESPDDRAAQEKYLKAIMIEPTGIDVDTALAQFPGLVNALIPASLTLVGRLQEENAKK